MSEIMKEHVPGICPRFHQAVELIGRRWTGALLQMLMDGRRRYSDLKIAIPEISDRMLSERLRELESEGLVRRIVTPETPVRVEYELTEKGCELREPLRAIGAWAEEWVSLPGDTSVAGGGGKKRGPVIADPRGEPEGS